MNTPELRYRATIPLVVGILLSLVFFRLVWGWTNPTQSPPNGNVSLPSAQWTASGTAIYNSNSGNVGVGTSSPATLFSVATSTNILNVTSAGNVGIGTASPSETLSVVGNMRWSGNLLSGSSGSINIAKRISDVPYTTETLIHSNVDLSTDGTGGAYIQMVPDDTGSVDSGRINVVAYGQGSGSDANAIRFFTRSGVNAVTKRMMIDSNGNVGIGLTPDTTQGSPNNDVRFQAVGRLGYNGTGDTGANSLCWGTGSTVRVIGSCTSLRKYKANIQNLGLGLESVLKLEPREFDWKDPGMGGGHDLGFIAEEVEAVDPLLAEYGGANGALSGVKYSRLTALLVKAIQDLAAESQAREATLAAQIKTLKELLCLDHPHAEICK